MDVRVRCRYSTSVVSIHGPATASTTTAATIFGTKLKVASWICVAAWKMLTTRPTARMVSSSGAATISSRYSDCCPKVKTAWESMQGVLGREACGQRAEQQVPAVGQHEQHQLELQGHEHRAQHHHAEAHEHARHDHVDDEEGNED